MNTFNIALDGPAGAGKSTAARLVADALGFIYVDTGAMYRAVTWKMLQEGIPLDRDDLVAKAVTQLQIGIRPGPDGQSVSVNGEDVTRYIRSAEVTANVSRVSQIPEVRRILVEKQKNLATAKGVVMDGRDIGTKVLPDAEVKVFLTASPRKRAERRYLEMNDPSITLDELERDITARDGMDASRAESPLVQADDAILLDTTELSLEQVVEAVLELCRAKTGGGA